MGNDASRSSLPANYSYYRRPENVRWTLNYMPRGWQWNAVFFVEDFYDDSFSEDEDDEPVPNPQGYPDEIFLNLGDQSEYECSICFCVLKDSRKCVRGHKFCYDCIVKWINQYSRLRNCPICRAHTNYAVDTESIEYLHKKAVQCSSTAANGTKCNWKGILAELGSHVHKQYTEQENRTHLKKSTDYSTLYPEAKPAETAAPAAPAPAQAPAPAPAPAPNAVLTPTPAAATTAKGKNAQSNEPITPRPPPNRPTTVRPRVTTARASQPSSRNATEPATPRSVTRTRDTDRVALNRPTTARRVLAQSNPTSSS